MYMFMLTYSDKLRDKVDREKAQSRDNQSGKDNNLPHHYSKHNKHHFHSCFTSL